jgi:16S rRNA (cytidine1402-2'-O)-methyltransferase
MYGKIFIVATPIGNLKDITFRALEVLKLVDYIACEDTRHASILIKEYFYESQKEMYGKLFAYYEENESGKIPQILNLLTNGKNVALISDAGTPTISDPGFKLVRECKRNNINVISIPGASSVISSITASGLPTDKFIFLGFLPLKQGHRINLLENLKKSLENLSSTVVYFESPHKIIKNLIDLKSVFGDITLTVVREQTKIHEEIISLKISELLERYKKGVKGEMVILFNLKEF